MIGMMDWGIGGLSVYKALRDCGRTADVLYFSDSGCTPYGKLAKEQMRERFLEIANFFRDRGVSEVLVACHAASSALELVSGTESLGSVNFRSIIPASQRVVQRSRASRLGVIGGEATIRSGVYERALAGMGKQLGFCPAQPLSAFVEAGELDSPAVEKVVRGLLEKLGTIDSLLLACTHYPALAPVFQRVCPGLELLDPGADLAEAVVEFGGGKLEFFTTGDRGQSGKSAWLAFGVELA